MPMIAPQLKPEKQAVNLKLDRRLLELLKAYADCISSSEEYVLNEALLAMFAADADFRRWLEEARTEEARALEALLEERPAKSQVRRSVGQKTMKATVRQPGLDLTAAGSRTDR